MIHSNGFQFFNESKEHILDGQIIGSDLSLTLYAGEEMEHYDVSYQEVLELAQALINLVEEAKSKGHDATTYR